MLLHSIHTLANLALKETVPAQSRPKQHVTVKMYIQYSEFRASASCSKILNAKSILNTVKNFRANFAFHGKRKSCSKILNGKKYIQYSENFEGKLYFPRHTQVAQKS